MLTLTEEQIEAAAKAIYEANERWLASHGCPHLGPIWEKLLDSVKQEYVRHARAAAPFLQAPWEMPTDEEVHLLCDAVERKVSSSNGGIHPETLLMEFVSRRNAALLPKPADPRRECIIVALLDGTAGDRAIAEKLVDRIIAALDSEASHG